MTMFLRAESHALAELVDAGRLSEQLAADLSLAEPFFDGRLLCHEPIERPSVIRPTPLTGDRLWVSEERWLEDTDVRGEVLARDWEDGWIVLAEHSELRRLDRDAPREIRTQVVGSDVLTRGSVPGRISATPLRELCELSQAVRPEEVIYHWDPSFLGPSAWLSIHPVLARACGWEQEEARLLAWRDEDGVVCESIWWRSGWLDMTNLSGHDEVGEGWLVVVAPRGLVSLRSVIGELSVAWQINRDFCAPDHGQREVSGLRSLAA